MKRVVFFAFTLAAAACARGERTQSEFRETASESQVAADNTRTNERDRERSALTAGDQGGSEADRTITQQVQKGVLGHDDLSMTADNVKIITIDGVVALRGPVKTDQERSTIETIARRVDGVKRVDNQLEIAGR